MSTQNDLDKERKEIMKQWVKQRALTERVMDATVGACGEMRGITGKLWQANKSLELETQVTDGNETKALSST